jgi:hypothetical protein
MTAIPAFVMGFSHDAVSERIHALIQEMKH